MTSQNQQANIVVILADDLGYGDLACFGRRDLATPHIDRMATEGVRFSDFHSNGAMCSPTRAALLTGRYPQRSGIEVALGKNQPGLPQESVTIAQRLREAGYATAIFGKWHLGDEIAYNPIHYGFDEFRGHTYGDSDYISHVDRQGDPDWWHDLRLEDEEGYNTTLITDHAVRFIGANAHRPFFLYVSHSAIHFPWMTPQDPAHRQKGTDYTHWQADMDTEFSKLGPHRDVGPVVQRMIEELDKSVGRILDALKSNGLDENTFVLFTSDNGGYRNYGGLHEGEISSNGPLRGQKGLMYEGGHRVPAIARWPGRIKADTESNQLATTMDLFPTFLRMAGARQDARHPPLDGTAIPALLGEQEAMPRRTLFWKMRDRRAARCGPWKLVQTGQAPPELYNLDEDIAENRDVAAHHSDHVDRLTMELSEWEATSSAR